MAGGPSSGQLRTDLDIMSTVSSSFDTDYAQLAADMKTLMSEGEDYASRWAGTASGSFQTTLNNVGVAWNALNMVIDEIAQNIKKSGVNYSNSDQDAGNKIASVDATSITSILGRH